MTQAFLYIGKGHTAMEQFAMIMNMSKLSGRSFHDHAIKVATEKILEEARCDVRKAYSELYADGEIPSPLNISVSYDGTWHTRGHTSCYGVGCVIDLLTGFIIDYEIMSKYCQECHIAAKDLDKDSCEYNMWQEGHAKVCSVNHEGPPEPWR
ncbi:hypothetical protein ANN_07033 [Periplaneta americana]|uniref:Mutator-like transposase domain-containing protein n=1 Tax=Periplaneta americana TaxID=6978 RepID=A0ABQ8THL0_PERAM|nr:hypothetical protein ANN_07033 [Periplaneta americana]